MSKTGEKVQEVQVLTTEQINNLPEVVKENVVFLTKRVNATDLAELNPLVTELLEIKEQGSKLIFAGKDEEGNYPKDNIQEFVDVKKAVRTYRAKVKKSATALKEEPKRINKAIIAIEKTFTEEATKVYNNAEKLFDEYIKHEEEVKKERERKKNEALLKQVEESQKQSEQANLKLEITALYNKLKYEKITNQLVSSVQLAVVESNKEGIERKYNSVREITWNDIIEDENVSILEQDVLAELQEFFIASRKNALAILNNKLQDIARQEQSIADKATVEAVKETVLPTQKQIVNEAGEIPLDTPLAIRNHVMKEVKKLLITVDNFIIKNPATYTSLKSIKEGLENIK